VGQKIAIVLVWLALPLAALLLLSLDYQRYQSELDSQLKYAQARGDLLLHYSADYANSARAVETITDPQARIMWDELFNQIQDQQKQDEQLLGDPGLSHYPMARDVLQDATRLLGQQHDYIRDAARLQDAYAKTDNGLDDLSDEAWQLQGLADRARMFGMLEIYLQYQDALARVEDQLQNRTRRRYELSNELNVTLYQADSYRQELRRLVATLPDKIKVDQGRTYREDLAQRFSNFNLRDQLRQILVGADAAQAAQKP